MSDEFTAVWKDGRVVGWTDGRPGHMSEVPDAELSFPDFQRFEVDGWEVLLIDDYAAISNKPACRAATESPYPTPYSAVIPRDVFIKLANQVDLEQVRRDLLEDQKRCPRTTSVSGTRFRCSQEAGHEGPHSSLPWEGTDG